MRISPSSRLTMELLTGQDFLQYRHRDSNFDHLLYPAQRRPSFLAKGVKVHKESTPPDVSGYLHRCMLNHHHKHAEELMNRGLVGLLMHDSDIEQEHMDDGQMDQHSYKLRMCLSFYSVRNAPTPHIHDTHSSTTSSM